MSITAQRQTVKRKQHRLLQLVFAGDGDAGEVALQTDFVAFAVRADVERAAVGGETITGLRIAVIHRQQVQRGIGRATVTDAGIGINQRFALSQFKQFLHRIGIFQFGVHRGHAGNQVAALQLSKRERTVVDGFVEHDALTRLQQRIVFGLRTGLNHQFGFAAEYATLVILIAERQTAIRRVRVDLAVGILQHLIHVAFQLFTGKPRCASPDYAERHNHTYGNLGLFHR